MLAQIMLIEELLLHIIRFAVKDERIDVHRRNFFHNDGVMNCFHRIFSPHKRTVAVHKNPGDRFGIPVPKGLQLSPCQSLSHIRR